MKRAIHSTLKSCSKGHYTKKLMLAYSVATRPPYALRAYIELQSRRVKPTIKIPARLHSYNSHPILNQFLLNPQPTPIQSSSNSHPFSSDSCPIIIPLFSISHPIFIILPKFSPNYHSIFYPLLIPFFLNSFILIQIFILIYFLQNSHPFLIQFLSHSYPIHFSLHRYPQFFVNFHRIRMFLLIPIPFYPVLPNGLPNSHTGWTGARADTGS